MERIWFPFTPTEDLGAYPPIVMERGEGVWLYDAAGKPYLDAISSWWTNTLGHAHPRIAAAVKAQADTLEHVMMAGFVSPKTLETAQLLHSLLPAGLGHIFFSDDGSTAVEAALKIALQYWKQSGSERSELVSFSGAYHGDTLGAMTVGMIPDYHDIFHARFKQCHYMPSPYCYRCPDGKRAETCGAECVDAFETFLADRGGKTAACMIEPMVQAAAGMRVYPAKVLRRIAELCRRHGVLLIADEVATGFGRTGRMFACEHAGVTPDILCCAKGLTGGFLPLAATAVTDRVYDAFRGDFLSGRTFCHGHSFTGNPLGCAAAAASLSILIERNIPESLSALIRHFTRRLHETFDDVPWVGDVRSIGMIGALELAADRSSKQPFNAADRVAFRICRHALENGVIVRPLGQVIYFIPPYVITPDEIDRMFETVRRAIETAAGHA